VKQIDFDFKKIRRLLRLSIDDPTVVGFFGKTLDFVERHEFTGSLEFKSQGVGGSFAEAPWVLRPEFIKDPATLVLDGFFFYGEGLDGYSGYRGDLPNGVHLGDSEKDIISKMGEPDAKGGGTTDQFGIVRTFYRYFLDNDNISFDFHVSGRVNLICLSSPIM
jgi:hypothetical protein